MILYAVTAQWFLSLYVVQIVSGRISMLGDGNENVLFAQKQQFEWFISVKYNKYI